MTREEAIDKVKQFLRRERASATDTGKLGSLVPDVWSVDTDLRTNAVIETIAGPLAAPEPKRITDTSDPPQWGFFVDDMPGANWEHPARYVFVHESGNVSQVQSTTPPSEKQNYPIQKVSDVFVR